MFVYKYNFKNLFLHSDLSFVSFICKQPLLFVYDQNRSNVDVYMKWKKDSSYDSIDCIHRSLELKPLNLLKNFIVNSKSGCIPISDVSKKALELGVPMKVPRFLRLYPSIFEEFTGPQYNLPWFRLTPRAIELHEHECSVYRDYKNRLLLKIIQQMQWYLGIPDEFLRDSLANLDESFRIVEMEDGLKGLAVEVNEKITLSTIQENALKKGANICEPIGFSFFPSNGLRLKMKISDWLNVFMKLHYVSPYEDYSVLRTDSDVSKKRVVGVLHELLGLFVEHSAERKMFLCLRKYLGLPQKVHKVFERHPHIFYLSLKNKTCTPILKEPYNDSVAIRSHPLSKVRKKYINLMKESGFILKQ